MLKDELAPKASESRYQENDDSEEGRLDVDGLTKMMQSVAATQYYKDKCPDDAPDLLALMDYDENETIEEDEFIEWICVNAAKKKKARKKWAKQSKWHKRVNTFMQTIIDKSWEV